MTRALSRRLTRLRNRWSIELLAAPLGGLIAYAMFWR